MPRATINDTLYDERVIIIRDLGQEWDADALLERVVKLLKEVKGT
jgi:hypothetical protein